jgi:hypothetical protein
MPSLLATSILRQATAGSASAGLKSQVLLFVRLLVQSLVPQGVKRRVTTTRRRKQSKKPDETIGNILHDVPVAG